MNQRVLTTKTVLDPSVLKIGNAIKNQETGRWDCSVLYDNLPFVFLTPRCKLGGSGELKLTKSKFVEFIEKIEIMFISYLTENEGLFKGKKFTEERLRSSLEPTVDISDDGIIILNSLLSENLLCFDIDGSLIPMSEIGADVSAYVLVEKLSFTKELFKINFKTTCLKTSRVKVNVSFETRENEQPTETPVSENPDSFFD